MLKQSMFVCFFLLINTGHASRQYNFKNLYGRQPSTPVIRNRIPVHYSSKRYRKTQKYHVYLSGSAVLFDNRLWTTQTPEKKSSTKTKRPNSSPRSSNPILIPSGPNKVGIFTFKSHQPDFSKDSTSTKPTTKNNQLQKKCNVIPPSLVSWLIPFKAEFNFHKNFSAEIFPYFFYSNHSYRKFRLEEQKNSPEEWTYVSIKGLMPSLGIKVLYPALLPKLDVYARLGYMVPMGYATYNELTPVDNVTETSRQNKSRKKENKSHQTMKKDSYNMGFTWDYRFYSGVGLIYRINHTIDITCSLNAFFPNYKDISNPDARHDRSGYVWFQAGVNYLLI